MLVLSRKKNETIQINGQQVTIVVVDILRDKVRLGIEADRSISVHRGEIQEIVDQEKMQISGGV